MLGLIIALVSGSLMSIQGVFNTQVTKASSIWAASAFVQFSALIVCLGAWVITDRSSLTAVFSVSPKFMLLGGAIGAFITYTVIKSMDMLSPARAVMLIVIAQLVVAYVIELFGWFGVEKQSLEGRKVVGMLIAIVGIVVFKWK
jgi:transporter family-2 protein